MVPQSHGIVGIFDALGAKNFTPEQVCAYVESQGQILTAVRDKASGQAASRQLSVPTLFTFNDTIILALQTDGDNEYNAIKGFAKIVRRFISYSLTKRLFFRGAFSIGAYILKEDQHLIMGGAVTDAACWFEQPEFIGVVATPRASMIIGKYAVQDAQPPDFILFERELPCKKGHQHLYAVNWPKAFYVPGLRPASCVKGHEYACLLDLLSANEVPFGTEGKYRNTLEFFKNAPRQESEEAMAPTGIRPAN